MHTALLTCVYRKNISILASDYSTLFAQVPLLLVFPAAQTTDGFKAASEAKPSAQLAAVHLLQWRLHIS